MRLPGSNPKRWLHEAGGSLSDAPIQKPFWPARIFGCSEMCGLPLAVWLIAGLACDRWMFLEPLFEEPVIVTVPCVYRDGTACVWAGMR